MLPHYKKNTTNYLHLKLFLCYLRQKEIEKKILSISKIEKYLCFGTQGERALKIQGVVSNQKDQCGPLNIKNMCNLRLELCLP